MQRLGENYVALCNGRRWPTGTLWEEQHKASLVESADYVLRCYCHIALNSVRGRLTDNPAEYRWARCLANLASAGTPPPPFAGVMRDHRPREPNTVD